MSPDIDLSITLFLFVVAFFLQKTKRRQAAVLLLAAVVLMHKGMFTGAESFMFYGSAVFANLVTVLCLVGVKSSALKVRLSFLTAFACATNLFGWYSEKFGIDLLYYDNMFLTIGVLTFIAMIKHDDTDGVENGSNNRIPYFASWLGWRPGRCIQELQTA